MKGQFCEAAASRPASFCISQGLNGGRCRVRLTLLSAGCLSSYLFFHPDLETETCCFARPKHWGDFCAVLHSSPPELNTSEELVRLNRRGLGTGVLWSRIVPAALVLVIAGGARLSV